MNTFVKESNIKLLSVLGMVATFFAAVSVTYITPYLFIYEPEMPKLLAKTDE